MYFIFISFFFFVKKIRNCSGSPFYSIFCIRERSETEIKLLTPDSMKIKTLVPSERKYTVWTGDSILSSLTTFSN